MGKREEHPGIPLTPPPVARERHLLTTRSGVMVFRVEQGDEVFFTVQLPGGRAPSPVQLEEAINAMSEHHSLRDSFKFGIPFRVALPPSKIITPGGVEIPNEGGGR